MHQAGVSRIDRVYLHPERWCHGLNHAELGGACRYGGITPYAAIQVQSFHTPGYTETDAIANGFAHGVTLLAKFDASSHRTCRPTRAQARFATGGSALRVKSLR
jgi:hypothetical protein